MRVPSSEASLWERPAPSLAQSPKILQSRHAANAECYRAVSFCNHPQLITAPGVLARPRKVNARSPVVIDDSSDPVTAQGNVLSDSFSLRHLRSTFSRCFPGRPGNMGTTQASSLQNAVPMAPLAVRDCDRCSILDSALEPTLATAEASASRRPRWCGARSLAAVEPRQPRPAPPARRVCAGGRDRADLGRSAGCDPKRHQLTQVTCHFPA